MSESSSKYRPDVVHTADTGAAAKIALVHQDVTVDDGIARRHDHVRGLRGGKNQPPEDGSYGHAERGSQTVVNVGHNARCNAG